MAKHLSAKLIAIVLLTLSTGFLALPMQYQQKIAPSLPKWIENQKIRLGLDLQGGTQLEYKIDMRKVPEADQDAIVEGVKEVINRRVNALGVNEPNIFTSEVGDEIHIIVELAGIQDIEEAKKAVGKTIQLEFKEEKAELDPNEKEEVRARALAAIEKIKAKPENFEIIGKAEEQAYPGKVFYQQAEKAFFKNDPESIISLPDQLFAMEAGTVNNDLIELAGTDSQFGEPPGFAIYKILEKEQGEREIKEPKEVKVRHILISYQGADRAAETVIRTEEEAKKLADELHKRVTEGGEDFIQIAKDNTDEAAGKETGGELATAVKEGESIYVKEFTDAALALQNSGDVSPVTKTQFGYHIIKADSIKAAVNEKRTEPRLKVARVFFSTVPDPWKDTALTGEHFQHADVLFNDAYLPYVGIRFDDEGAKLFGELTKKNVGKRIAIFVGGDLISAPTVQQEITGGQASITGQFTLEEAENLARELNTGAIPAPVILSGQVNIGASLGADALQKSIKAGLLGIAVLALFMTFYYRFAGLLAVFALTIYSILLIFLIKIALPYAVALLISILVFIAVVNKVLKNHDSGWEKFITFLLACFVLFFLSFLLSNPLVLTLAGIAGIILSIGMAVDANVLIFERIKEELRDGKPLANAIEIGFDRAWLSIRDSNFSTLIICAILLYFGTSVIKGFAFNLATGVLISMFTAITITKVFLQSTIGAKWLQNKNTFIGINEKKAYRQKTFDIIGKRKIWYTLSGILFLAGLISIPAFGLKLGLDFTGGSLLEIKFSTPVTPQAIEEVIRETQSELNTQNSSDKPSSFIIKKVQAQNTAATEVNSGSGTAALNESAEVSPAALAADLGTPSIVSSGENTFIIKLKDINESTHNLLLTNLKEKLGKLEEIRFTTVGPTVGKTLQEKSLYALFIALVMIVLYIAFAFRKVPKKINPWRFSACVVIALIHDVFITFGIFVILGKFIGVEIDTLLITALLTLLGYSVNDTIVVFDRIRENLKLQERGETFEHIANKSLNQTMSRSLNTSLSTLFTIIAVFLFGAPSIKYFVLVLIFGIIIGTYSSIFIASPLLVDWNNRSKK